MNEKIKQFAEQAMDNSSKQLYPCLVMQGEPMDIFRIPAPVLEKFAELIVRRVISVYNDSETFKTSVYDDQRVLDYFGIEK
jgi:hypothetical protein